MLISSSFCHYFQVFRHTHQSPVTEISAVLNNGNIPVIRNQKEPVDVWTLEVRIKLTAVITVFDSKLIKNKLLLVLSRTRNFLQKWHEKNTWRKLLLIFSNELLTKLAWKQHPLWNNELTSFGVLSLDSNGNVLHIIIIDFVYKHCEKFSEKENALLFFCSFVCLFVCLFVLIVEIH